MAPGTLAHVLRVMSRRHVVMTALASSVPSGSHRMGLVTTAADAVLWGRVLRQDFRSLVARGALERSRCGKRMRLMACRARIVTTAERRGSGHLWLFGLVTLHAGRRVSGKLVPAVTVGARSAQARPSVLDFHLLVAFVALPHRFFSGLVRIVTTLTRH